MKKWKETDFSPSELIDIDMEEIGIFISIPGDNPPLPRLIRKVYLGW